MTTSTLIIDRDVDLTGAERGTAWRSADDRYRYLLTRRWDVLRPPLPVVMMNPSTAGAFTADPTITRCAGFARRDKYGGLEVANLYAYRATHPDDLYNADDPIGPDNDTTLADLAGLSPVIVVAWGALAGQIGDRAREVTRILTRNGAELRCLGVTKDGHPRHPLYVRGDTPLIPWEAPA
jgi:hypothetical protein